LESEIILNYFPNLTETQISQFEQLGELYREWNQKINVISRKDIDNLYSNHILHALGIAKVIDFVPETRILDVGTGGGFPGIPLAILFPEVSFHLVDSIGKKIKVVNAVSEAIGLKNIEASHVRAEKVAGMYDFVVARAVTRISPFYNWVKRKIKSESKNTLKNGILYLKGGDLKEEFADFKHHVRFYDLNNYFEEEFYETKKVVYVS
jgi:16S rRNA (guanine527-N7)-methyltransferase